jgi:hypothetical protein
VIQCAPGVFPAPGYVLVAWADFDDKNDWQRHHTILGQDNSLIADMSEDVSVHERRDNDLSIDSVRAVDFDNDGRTCVAVGFGKA